VPGALAPEREQRLLVELENIFLAEGGLRLTLSELAARLRCSKRALYQIAPSKEALFLKVLEKSLEHIWQLGLEAEQRARTTQDSISEYVMAALVEVRKWSPAFLADIHGFAPARRMLDAHLDQRMRYLVHMIDDGIEAGMFNRTNSALVAEMLYASAMSFCSPAFLERAGLTLGQAVEQMCAVICHGMVRSGQRAAASRMTKLPIESRRRPRPRALRGGSR
jgi:AcrR family transcriptional regulator